MKLRKNDCPKRSESEGKPRAHHWIARRKRCSHCEPAERWKATRTCERQHPNVGVCNFCWTEDPERHFCDMWVSRGYDFGPCDRPAKVEQVHTDLYGRRAKGWLCSLHTNEAVAAKREERDARFAAMEAKWAAERARTHAEEDARDLVAEMARWIAANRDLVDEDEWLGRIAERMATNDVVQERLAGRVSSRRR